MKKLIMLVTLSLGAFVFAGDEDTAPSVPNCPPACGVKTDKNSDKKPAKKTRNIRTPLR